MEEVGQLVNTLQAFQIKVPAIAKGNSVVWVGNVPQKEVVRKGTGQNVTQIKSAFGETVRKWLECRASVVEHSGQKMVRRGYEPWLKP